MPRKRDVGKRYARSLFQVCIGPEKESVGSPEEILVELKAFQGALQTNAELSRFFFNPVIRQPEKFEVLDELQSKLRGSLKFLKVLIENGRLECLGDVIDEFQLYKEDHEGLLKVDLEVAYEPSDELIEKIRGLLENLWKRRPEFEVKVNRELMGGFIAHASGRTFDASIRSQLNRMSETLIA